MALPEVPQVVGEVFGANNVRVEMDEQVPFEVGEQFALGDLSEVKEDRTVLPVSSNVLLRISRASSRLNAKSGITSLNLQVNLVEGVDVPEKDQVGNLTGNLTKKYANKVEFVELPYKVDPALRTEPRWVSKNRPYLIPLKQFVLALGYDLKNAPTIGDAFCQELTGREFRADIIHREVRRKNPVSGEYEGTGEYRHQFQGFRVA